MTRSWGRSLPVVLGVCASPTVALDGQHRTGTSHIPGHQHREEAGTGVEVDDGVATPGIQHGAYGFGERRSGSDVHLPEHAGRDPERDVGYLRVDRARALLGAPVDHQSRRELRQLRHALGVGGLPFPFPVPLPLAAPVESTAISDSPVSGATMTSSSSTPAQSAWKVPVCMTSSQAIGQWSTCSSWCER